MSPTDGKGSAKGAARRKTVAREGPKKRDREVLDAAARVFYERGYSDASVQDVADELGILKGSLYHYIKTKEDLLFRLFEQVHKGVEAILEEVLAVEGLNPLERIELYVRRQIVHNLNDLTRISIYYHDADQLSEERRRELYRKRRVHEKFVSDLITEAQQRGEANADLDPKVVANCLFGSMIWVYRWYKPGGKLRPTELADTCAEFVLRGVVGDVPSR